MLRLDDCVVDLHSSTVRWKDREYRLTEAEVQLLQFLSARPGTSISRGTLLQEVWNYAPTVQSRAVDQTVKRLRPKIETDPSNPRHLITIHGVGYRFNPSSQVRTPGPTNLTPANDPFIHRSLDRLDERIASSRWVTVLGPGGIGKTRTIQEWARERRQDWPGGIWFCDLAAAFTTDELLHAVAQAIGVAALGLEETLEDTLIRNLGERPATLLIWDNLEQVAEPARSLGTSWLRRLSGLSVLATSRHRIHMSGEAVLELEPLPKSNRVALLVARAAQIGVEVAAEDPEARAIVDALEGIPLAIELAAARLNLLSLRQLRERLSIDLLRSRQGGRHGTLRAALEWSWKLLSVDEQEALAHITVFPGTFDLPSVEAVLNVENVLDMLQNLRDRSWIRATAGQLHLFDTVRRFAAAHLDDTARRIVEQRHASFVLDQVAALPVEHAPGWIHSPNPRHDDLLAIYERFEHTQPDLAARAILANHHSRWRLQSPAESRAQLEHALTLTHVPEVVARLHTCLANLEGPDPLLALDAAWAVVADLPPSTLQLDILLARARHESGVEDFGAALTTLDHADRVYESVDQPIWMKNLAIERARTMAHSGRYQDAVTHIAAFCEHADPDFAVSALYTTGYIHLEFGAAKLAETTFARVLSIAPERRPILVGLLGITAVEQGDTVRGRALLAEGHKHTKNTENWRFFAEDLAELSHIDHLEGNLSDAIAGYRRTASMMSDLGMSQTRILVLALLVIACSRHGLDEDVASTLDDLDKWSSASPSRPIARRLCEAAHAVIANDTDALRRLRQTASSGAICALNLRRVLRFAVSE